jgi:hypothetical protein
VTGPINMFGWSLIVMFYHGSWKGRSDGTTSTKVKKMKYTFVQSTLWLRRVGVMSSVSPRFCYKKSTQLICSGKVQRRLYGRVTASCWEELPAAQRWALYWSCSQRLSLSYGRTRPLQSVLKKKQFARKVLIQQVSTLDQRTT